MLHRHLSAPEPPCVRRVDPRVSLCLHDFGPSEGVMSDRSVPSGLQVTGGEVRSEMRSEESNALPPLREETQRQGERRKSEPKVAS